MFERELTDAMFLQRWGIVRTLMPQSVAEHTFSVAHYANDIAVFMKVDPKIHLALLQNALWHDVKDEVFTGDLPGPNKRGLLDEIGPEAKEAWDRKLSNWANEVFSNLEARMGSSLPLDDAATVKYILKVADWLEAAVRMATEAQMGNGCAVRHIAPNLQGARETARLLCEHFFNAEINTEEVPLFPDTEPAQAVFRVLDQKITECVDIAWRGQSRAPFITREDEGRL